MKVCVNLGIPLNNVTMFQEPTWSWGSIVLPDISREKVLGLMMHFKTE